MLKRLWRHIRPHRIWIILASPVELLGGLLLAANFLADGKADPSMLVASFILIATPLPWLVVRVYFARLWRVIRRFPLVMAIAVVAWLLGGLFTAMAFDPDEVHTAMAIIGPSVMAGPLLWLAARVFSLRRHRRRNVRELRSILVDGQPLGPDTFIDAPFVISGPRIYYSVDNALKQQDVANLVWAYGEVFSGWFLCQLVILNRDAHAVVLPMLKSDVSKALDQLRAAAPWIASGFNRALVDSWNFDHREFLDVIDRHREARTIFAPPWAAGAGLVSVLPRTRSDNRIDAGTSKRKEMLEIEKAMARWAGEQPTDAGSVSESFIAD